MIWFPVNLISPGHVPFKSVLALYIALDLMLAAGWIISSIYHKDWGIFSGIEGTDSKFVIELVFVAMHLIALFFLLTWFIEGLL